MRAAHSLLFYSCFLYQSTIQLTDICWVGRNMNIDKSMYVNAYSRSYQCSAQTQRFQFTFL